MSTNIYGYCQTCIPTLLTTVFVWFAGSEFTWLWLIAGNRSIQCDGTGEIGVSDEDSGLTVRV